MDGHLYVMGRISTPSWGKPGAGRYYGDPLWGQRVETRVSTILHCHGFLDSVANKNEAANKVIKKQKKKKSRKQKSASLRPWCMRMRAVREFNLSSLLLRAGDVHPNPGPALRIAQFNILGFTPGKRLSLLHKAITHDLDVILLQELHIVENEASRLSLDGYQCFAVARDAKGGGVAVHIRKGIQCSLTSQSVSEVVEQATVCVKVGAHLCQFTSAYFPRGNKVTSAAVHSLSQADWTTHVICADANCHHANWDKHVAPNPGGSYNVDFCIDEGYTLLNTGDTTRRSLTIERGQLSAPDVTLDRGCTTQRWQATPDQTATIS